MNIFHRHKWSPWKQYNREFENVIMRWGVVVKSGVCDELWQQRACSECHYEQRRLVAEGSGHVLFNQNGMDQR